MEKVSERKKQEYEKIVKEKTPVQSLWKNMAGAFVTGGLICTLGQMILNICKTAGLEKMESASWCALVLIFLSAFLTGLGVYSRIAQFAGAGTLVPITGFANSVAAPAIEFKKEGQVFGIGCKIFTIAGPVILYGIVSSWFLGLIYYIVTVLF